MSDEQDTPAGRPEIDASYLNAKFDLAAKRISPDILTDPDYIARRDLMRHSRILVSKDRKSFAVLSPSGAPMPGSGVALQRLAGELVAELEAAHGPSTESIMQEKRNDSSYSL